jgi:hypothetical protein
MLFSFLLPFPQVGLCGSQADVLPPNLGRCKSAGVEYSGEHVCRVSFSGLVAHAERLDEELVQVSGVLALLYDLPVLVRFSPASGLNDSLDTFALTGPWVEANEEIEVRQALELPQEIETDLRSCGHAQVSLIGRFRLGAEPSMADQNLGTIEVLHLVRNARNPAELQESARGSGSLSGSESQRAGSG